LYNDTFSITKTPLGSYPTISPSDFPLSSDCILYSWTMSPFTSYFVSYKPSIRALSDSFTSVTTRYIIG
jgi:hypothetical protein